VGSDLDSVALATAVADAFITDQHGRILLTQPTYRPAWVPSPPASWVE
jgi:hypothetical protein